MRWRRRVFAVLLVLVVALGGWIVYLAKTSPDPHAEPGWTRLKDLPRARGEAAGALAIRVDPSAPSETPEHLAVIGGIASAGRTVPWVDFYDASSNAWARGPDLP